MKALAALQRDFLDSVLAEEGGAGRIAVYRRSMDAAHLGALAATYPVTRRLVGESFFGEASRVFARAAESTGGDLNVYGEAFAAFLAGYPPARELAYLPDIARLEWACHESELAADAPAFDFAALARVPADALGAIRFTLAPSVRLFASAHPVASIWEANQPTRDGVPRAAEGPERALVWRRDGEVRVESTDESDWNALNALARGKTLAEAAADARFLKSGLARYVQDGVIAGFRA